MWTSAQLKARAKEKLKKYFLEALLVSFIVGLITGSSGSVSTGGTGITMGTETEDLSDLMEESFEWGEHVLEGDYDRDEIIEQMPMMIRQFLGENRLLTGILVGTILVSLIISLIIGIFVIPIIEVSKNRYYMESRAMDRGAGIGKLLWGFNRNYLNIIWTMFLRSFIIFLGSLCCGLPGIYAAFCFYMVPYILAENPGMSAGEALRMSNEMMKGNKFRTFVLRLSFIGWSILAALIGVFTCGLGSYLVIPYIEATMAELYAELRIPFAGGLNGFGNPEHGPYGPANDNYVYGQYEERGEYYAAQQSEFSSSERNEYPGEGKEPGIKEHADGSRNPDFGSDQGRTTMSDSRVQTVVSEPWEKEQQVNNETGHVRGYYLNGVFYPYSEEELKAMDGEK